MRRLILAGIAVIAMLTPASPASAITYGLPDGNAHPEVGALLAPQAYPDGTWETCSGTLISPTVFLTAAHCDQGVARVAVTFDSSYDPRTGTTYWGSWHADPNYNQAQSDPQDVAVVVLDRPVRGITPARLPAAGTLNGLNTGTRFTSVGYGAQSVTIDKGPTFHYADIRIGRSVPLGRGELVIHRQRMAFCVEGTAPLLRERPDRRPRPDCTTGG